MPESKQTSPPSSSSSSSSSSHPLRRDVAEGMNPTSLLTGFYGARRERIRHIAHKGALTLPQEALEILSVKEDSSQSEQQQQQQQQQQQLPELDSVHPPTQQETPYIVTDVSLQVAADVQPDGSKVYQTHAKNRTVVKTGVDQTTTTTAKATATERIRGGGGSTEGGGGGGMDMSTPMSAGEAAAAAAAASASSNVTPLPMELPNTAVATATAVPPVVTAPPTGNVSSATAAVANATVATPASLPNATTATTGTTATTTSATGTAATALTGVTVAQTGGIRVSLPAALTQQQQKQKPTTTAATIPQPSLLAAAPGAVPRSAVALGTTGSIPTPTTGGVPTPTAATTAAPATGAATISSAASAAATSTVAPTPVVRTAAPMMTTATTVPSTTATTANTATTNNPAVVPTPVAAAVASAPATTTSSAAAVVTATTTTAAAAAKPAPVVSNAPKQPPPAAAKIPSPQVAKLAKRPAPQWEQHMPGPNDEMQVDPAHKSPNPAWYKPDQVSTLEQKLLPEWFNHSAPHRTPESYLKVREAVVKLSRKLGTRYVTATMIRRAIPGDAGSLLRLHQFCTTYGLINQDAMNDSAPIPMELQEQHHEQAQQQQQQGGDGAPDPKRRRLEWDEALRQCLVEAVVQEARTQRAKRGIPSEDDFVPIDWVAVAKSVGHGKTPSDCEGEFLILPHLEESSVLQQPQGSTTDEGTEQQQQQQQEQQESTTATSSDTDKASTNLKNTADVLRQLVQGCDPRAIHAATKAALQVTLANKQNKNNNDKNKLAVAQKAATIGLVASRAAEQAQAHESTVAHVLNELVEVRMQKLENRLALLDDVEGMLEAERVALELERRDLYTARCRHWFQGP